MSVSRSFEKLTITTLTPTPPPTPPPTPQQPGFTDDEWDAMIDQAKYNLECENAMKKDCRRVAIFDSDYFDWTKPPALKKPRKF
jgi:hypothetical protein